MSVTADRQPLRLLTFTPGQPKDVGQVISSCVADIRRVSQAAAIRLQDALGRVIRAELRRWLKAETGGAQ